LSQAKDFALALVNVSGIRGVFNVDFILDEDSLVPVDINPRIPGSAEVIGDHVMENHLRAFGIESLNAKPNGLVITGKLVVFNQSKGPLKFSTELLGDVLFRFANAESESAIADVPMSPSVIEPGAPVLTVFACGNSIEQVQAKLRQKQSEILHRLGIQNTEIEA
jgi:predicted ATP-grasp superfamily ATP-dependent carboligase